MTTTLEFPVTRPATGQVNAAGALLAVLSAHGGLPTPNVDLRELSVPGRPRAWGLRITLHDGLDQFEQWRDALDLDPAAVDHHQNGGATLAWLTATGTAYGVPVELVGYYDLPKPAPRRR